MKSAVKGACKWFKKNIEAGTIANPIPFPLFKAILDKQIGWALTNRHITLDFQEVSEAVRFELLRSRIKVLFSNESPQKAPAKTEAQLSIENESTVSEEIFPALTLNLKANTDLSMLEMFKWFHSVLDRAVADNSSMLQFSVESLKEDEHA